MYLYEMSRNDTSEDTECRLIVAYDWEKKQRVTPNRHKRYFGGDRNALNLW